MTEQHALAEDQMTDAAAAQPARRRRRTPWLIAGACVAVLGIAGGVLAVTLPASSKEDGDGAAAADVATTPVDRGDLTERVRLNGRLGYGSVQELGTSLGGTITWLPDTGAVLDRGATLFRLDDDPVVLLIGALPMWRGFAEGMDDGPDVLQLEQNLAALGFFEREPDEEFAGSTAAAIERWQDSLGLEETGAIEPGRIVFAPAAVRVAQHKAQIGGGAGASVIAVSDTVKRVTAFIAPNLEPIAPVGTPVQLTLPGGATVPGKVSAVGAPVEQDDDQGGKKLKLPLTITLDDPAAADGLDDVAVNGELTAVRREDALLVPVTALLARTGGGFAVEVVAKGVVETVPVELGLFADGLVEVTGGELEAGDEVVVPE
ncbi:multidrug efflux pump subunit AcrA (membrane-fusion protein) [Agromyces hippuratus]|uniref:Multidrug efflux pump subunit AcrA (Membrane-fusion protein) n=1 Tax=Agromyces hippuratus TaxID=286438 RepID=A0A852X150_9MICO|nr:efflux RND transporter periplasmic adaptor subunit [Agromyces hippuratus]NYG22260.1 multidrug efflux pump subunit AcrA (membrane-fusion protein) [Agromyces hippuratus]